mmetsp:Transcript_4666/g.7068  ORF Transcript_4666/g.7068 Transcript_4666/m.7068 type:complete len:83 (+) Transcript_4666:1644-1892(+)
MALCLAEEKFNPKSNVFHRNTLENIDVSGLAKAILKNSRTQIIKEKPGVDEEDQVGEPLIRISECSIAESEESVSSKSSDSN